MKLTNIVPLFLLAACSHNLPLAYQDGEYDDPNQTRLIDDKFNEADFEKMSNYMINSISQCRFITGNAKVLMYGDVDNKTEEHIDLASLKDQISTGLISKAKVRFINKAERDTLKQEYQYGDDGFVAAHLAKKKGNQIAPDYVMSGALSTNVQEMGVYKYVYYKLTLKLTNTDTSGIDCQDEIKLRKKFLKKEIPVES